MPDHHRSEWLVREEFRFFHLYFTPAHFTRIAEQACDKEGVICNWKTRPSSTIPRRWPWCRGN